MSEETVKLDENILWIGHAGFEGFFEKIIVLQDDYKSGYECPRCLGKDVRTVGAKELSMISCDNCNGQGHYERNGSERKCAACDGRGVIVCPDCGGLGGTLIMPEQSQGRPTTGIVLSIGEDVKRIKCGDKILYPSTAGHAFDIKGNDKQGNDAQGTVVVMYERDVLARLHGSLEYRDVRRSMALHTVE